MHRKILYISGLVIYLYGKVIIMSTQVGMNTGLNSNLYQNNYTAPAVNPVMPNMMPANILVITIYYSRQLIIMKMIF